MAPSRILVSLALLLSPALAWTPGVFHEIRGVTTSRLRTRRFLAKDSAKGFGKKKPKPERKLSAEDLEALSPKGRPGSALSSDEGTASASRLGEGEEAGSFPDVSPSAREALEQMRMRRDEAALAVEAKREERKEVQEVLKENPTAGVIPDKVAQRMLFRMLPLAGVPIFGGIALFVYFYLSATKGDVEFQPTVVAYATTAPWLLGLAGLTFGILSSSWDEDREGSFLGFDEVQLNLGRVLDGLRRASDNADLRDMDNQ